METLQHGDPNVGIRDLEDQRKEIVALSGIPSSYLGYLEGFELRDQLVHINIQFATTISSIQHVINTGMNDLMNRIALDLGFEEPMDDYVRISLVPPVTLILQVVESSITSVSNIQRMFMEFPILKDSNPMFLLEKYVPYINWNEFAEEAKSFKLKQDVLKNQQPQPPGGQQVF